ncbi:GNAT family N-acetyltransferase [Sphingorhabdus sp. Alg239-R122]|uniref:GNAT family N-acetyltransferase n=1 Tax=Sphingorhabdus sp. Alg239-R122 TaxID=2305989 RepID=UPI0013D958BA|nr:GNAT family N-acetyltransferase [Sphingorhabdus sp. Alg239-R122]
MEFREYKIADASACLALFDANTPPYFDPSERPLFAKFLENPEGHYFVLKQGGEISGCGGYRSFENGQAVFTWGMVAPDYHGAGLGRKLTEHRLGIIAAEGSYTGVRVHTSPMIEPFFNHMGFVTLRTQKDGFAPSMDKVYMEMAL